MRDKRNYLDFVPVKNPQLPWQEDEGAIVTVEVTHRGLAAKVAQIAFNRPKVSHIHMDAFGSFIWKEYADKYKKNLKIQASCSHSSMQSESHSSQESCYHT